MDKETLSNYGWIVICVLVLAVMLALATPFGSFISAAIQSSTEGLFNVNQEALGAVGIDIGDNEVIPTPQPSVDELLSQGIVPEGGTYYVGVTSTTTGDYTGTTATYTAGQSMPEIVSNGDVFVYGDYEYRYNYYYNSSKWYGKNSNGWGVRVLDTTKTEYGAILENINGQPIKSLSHTFALCTSLTTAPLIPNSVVDLYRTFIQCTLLKTYVGSTDTDGDFSNYVIPSSVLSVDGTFMYCSNLITPPVIPSSVTNMGEAFADCTALTTAPVIPSSVTDMERTFADCTALTTAPTIPSNVKYFAYAFYKCTSLTGNIEINASPTFYTDCLKGTTKEITLSGSSTNLAKLAATANNDNVTVVS